MVLDFLKSYKIQLIFFMSFMGFFIFFSPFRDIEDIIFPFNKEVLLLYKNVSALIVWSRVFELFVTAILVVSQAILINKLNRKFLILTVNSYLPGVLFILISGSLMPLHIVQPILFSGFFLLLTIDQIFSSLKKEKALDVYFNAGLLIFVGSLFYTGILFYMIVVYAFITYFRSFYWKEWLMPVLGFFCPLAILCGFLYLADYTGTFMNNYMLNYRFGLISFVDIQISFLSIIFYSFITLLLFVSAIYYKNQKIDSSKYFASFLLMLILSCLIFLFFESSFIEIIFFLAIPVSYQLSYFLINIRKKWLGESIVLIILGLSVAIRFFG
ncbi:hypothetical protein ACFLTI_00970 [Bacteroidota bacterium]